MLLVVGMGLARRDPLYGCFSAKPTPIGIDRDRNLIWYEVAVSRGNTSLFRLACVVAFALALPSLSHYSFTSLFVPRCGGYLTVLCQRDETFASVVDSCCLKACHVSFVFFSVLGSCSGCLSYG
jgi:hypothetical protein